MRMVFSMLLVLSCALTAHAQPSEQDQCVEAYVASQRARKSGQLREAQTQALFCAREACSRVLRDDCVSWADQLASQIPSVVIDPRYDDGQAPLQVSVTLDGVALDARSLGRAVPLDPGEHHVVVAADGVQRAHSFRAVEGVQGQPVRVGLTRPAQAPVVPPSRKPRVAAWTLLGVAGAGLGGFAALATTGRLRERDLERACAPACARHRAEGITRLYRAADVALGVGVVAGVAGLWLWLRERRDEPKTAVDLRVSSERAQLWLERRF